MSKQRTHVTDLGAMLDGVRRVTSDLRQQFEDAGVRPRRDWHSCFVELARLRAEIKTDDGGRSLDAAEAFCGLMCCADLVDRAGGGDGLTPPTLAAMVPGGDA